jgi:hypothetical protein
MINNAISEFMFPMKCSCILFDVICNCLLIRRWKKLTVLTRLVITVVPNCYLSFFLLATYLAGKWYHRTKACIDSWKFLKLKTLNDVLFMKRFRSSCPPLKVQVGSFYFNRMTQVILTANTVCWLTLKTLIYLKKT